MRKVLIDLLSDRELPVKVHKQGWVESIYFEIRYIFNIKAYGHFSSDHRADSYCLHSKDWKIYEEPKKKVKLYKWALKNNKSNCWFETERFFENQNQLENEAYYTKPHYTEFIRLDHTMIEVEE